MWEEGERMDIYVIQTVMEVGGAALGIGILLGVIFALVNHLVMDTIPGLTYYLSTEIPTAKAKKCMETTDFSGCAKCRNVYCPYYQIRKNGKKATETYIQKVFNELE